jgi:hypothetical protein
MVASPFRAPMRTGSLFAMASVSLSFSISTSRLRPFA